MGGITTWITCRRCGKIFGVGCVMEDDCRDCREAACVHDWKEFEDGPAICRHCYKSRPQAPNGTAHQEA